MSKKSVENCKKGIKIINVERVQEIISELSLIELNYKRDILYRSAFREEREAALHNIIPAKEYLQKQMKEAVVCIDTDKIVDLKLKIKWSSNE